MNFKSASDMPRRKEGVRNETDTLSLESMPLRAYILIESQNLRFCSPVLPVCRIFP